MIESITINGRTPLSLDVGTQGGSKDPFGTKEQSTLSCRTHRWPDAFPPWEVPNQHHSVVNMFLERNDLRTAIPGDQNQAPQPSALPKRHDRAMDIPLELGHVNSDIASRGGHAFLPPPVQPMEESLMIQLPSLPRPSFRDYRFEWPTFTRSTLGRAGAGTVSQGLDFNVPG